MAAIPHQTPGGLDAEKGALQVHRQGLVPVRLGDVQDRGCLLDAGVVDEDMHRPEVLLRGREHLADLLRIGDIRL